MKYMLAALSVFSAHASELVVKGFSSHNLGDISLIRTDKGYEIFNGDKRTEVKPYDVDTLLKKLDKKKLAVFLNEGHGYPEITQLSNGDYKVRARVRGDGGGKVTGRVCYWLTKGICYGVLGAAAAVGIATVGKEVSKVVGPQTGAVLTEVAQTTISAPGGPAAPLVQAAVNSTPEGRDTATKVVTGALVLGVQRTVIVIEALSNGADVIGTAIPFLP